MKGLFNSSYSRFVKAAVISAIGIACTYFFSRYLNVQKRSTASETPVARVSKKSNEVLKRQSKRLIWKSVNENDELYAGEAIRTTSKAEVQIDFLKQGAIIRLEPDSVIEIQTKNNAINLDFLKGNIFVETKENANLKDADKLVLTSGDKQIKFDNSEVSLSKSDAKSEIEVQVHKGKVTQTIKGNVAPIEEAKLTILKPKVNENIYVDQRRSPSVAIEFSKFDSSYKVVAEVNDSPSAFGQFPLAVQDVVDEDSKVVAGNEGKIVLSTEVGKKYLRLLAFKEGEKNFAIKSPIVKFEVLAKVPPELLEPVHNSRLNVPDKKNPVQFRWREIGKMNDVQIEISKNAEFTLGVQKFVATKPGEFAVGLEDKILLDEERCNYFWRVIATAQNSGQRVASDVFHFEYSIGQKPGPEVPKLIAPASNTEVSLVQIRTGINLTWEKAKRADSYRVIVTPAGKSSSGKTNSVLNYSSEQTNLLIKDLPQGDYVWKVVAEDDEETLSPESEQRIFRVLGVAQLEWRDRKLTEKYVYRNQKISFRLAWEKGPGAPVKWKLYRKFSNLNLVQKLKQQREVAQTADIQEPNLKPIESTFDVSVTSVEQKIEGAGEYEYWIESMDNSNRVIARSLPRIVSVDQPEELEPPLFSDSSPQVLISDEKGNVSIEWKEVQDAQEYQIVIRDTAGKNILNEKTKQLKYAMSRVKPGQYIVSLKSIDVFNRSSLKSEDRKLQVQEYSDVRAPKIQKVKIK